MKHNEDFEELFAVTSKAVDSIKVRRALPMDWFISPDAWAVACAQVEGLVASARREERAAS